MIDDQKFADNLRINAFLSQRYRLLYVSTPKVACTSLKWWLASMEGYADVLRGATESEESDLDLVIHDNFYKVAPHITGLGLASLSEPMTSDAYFRFAVVRNPYKRIFSAWQSKLLLREPLQIGPYTKCEFFHHLIEGKEDIAAAFEGFLEHLANNETPSFWDHHWTPQATLLRPDLINYSKLVKIENASELSKALREWLGEYVPDPFASRRANESLIPYLPEFISERSAELIRSLYAEDFDVFGYDQQLPPLAETFSAEQLDVAIKAIKLIRARHERLGERAKQVKVLNRAAAERDAQVAELKQAVAQRDAQIVDLGQTIAQRGEQLATFDQSTAQRDQEIAALNQTIAQRDGQLSGLAQAVAQRDAQIVDLGQTIAQRGEQLATFDQSIAQRDQEIAALNQTIAQRDGQLSGLIQAVAQRDAQIVDLGQTIAQRGEQLATFDQSIAQRDQEIAALNQTIAQRDGQLSGLAQAVAQRDAQIVDLRQAIAESEERSRTLAHQGTQFLTDKDLECTDLRLELAEILRSRSWRVTGPLRRIVAAGWRVLSLGKKSGGRLEARRKRALQSEIRRISASTLFNAEYYLATYPDIRDAGIDPASHFAIHGWKEHRNPSAAFDTARYLAGNPDVVRAGLNPLVHYLRHGQKEERPVRPPAVAVEDLADTVSGTPDQFLSANDAPDDSLISHAHEIIADPAIIDGEVEAIRKSGLFDEAFYFSMYQDLQPSPQDPIKHYCERGWREGRNPSDDFDTKFYLATYSDIRNAGLNPFWHYVGWGAAELRHALPDSSVSYEDDVWFGAIETDIELLTFYTSPDWWAVRRGRPMFKGHSQPMQPGDELGYYDAQDWRILNRHAQMARRHGIRGFCFDLNVASDETVEPQPIECFLAHDKIDIRFCVQVAISSEDMVGPIAESLVRVFADRRQIRIEDRPVLLVKVVKHGLDAPVFLAHLRQLLAERGVEVPFVIGRWMGSGDDEALLADFCDAVLDLPCTPIPGETGEFAPLDKSGTDAVPYGVVASNGVARIEKVQSFSCPRYHAVTLGRDTTARGPVRPLVYTRFHIRDYRRWLDAAIVSTRAIHRDDRRFVFLNAWNAWDEGLYLEPDRKSGFSRLNETTRALLNLESGLRMPKVSVIVPNYNHEPFLRRRLESIYGQTYKNFDVLLLDDCSSDQSRAILNEYATAYPEITRTFYNDQNSGSAFRQWAKGLKEATGELVWIAESDDFCDKRFLDGLVCCFDDEAVLLAYGKSIFVDRDEAPLESGAAFENHLRDLNCEDKWTKPYIATAHNEVTSALGIKNTIPNASSAVFKRPVDMPLLNDESWLSMRVAGDWVFYLYVLRGGKIAYRPEAINFFRRYEGSAAETTYKTEIFYREVAFASRTVASLYDVPWNVLERCREACEAAYFWHISTGSREAFARWYDYEAIVRARNSRPPNILVSTMGFYPGGAEILPIRLVNELKRQGHSVLLFSAGLNPHEDGVRRMVRNDVPVVETPDVEDVKKIIHEFGIEALNSHQWHIQKYPLMVPDVFDDLCTHVASLHGMIEHGAAFEVTADQLRSADRKVTTWVYTAEKNLGPFFELGLYDKSSERFVKLPNGMQPPDIVPIPRARMNIPEDAFVLCCVSRAISDKGWAETIAAVEAARELSGRDVRLILVGNGPVYDEYCRAGVPDFVYVAGFSENSVGHYAAADMGIMLTKFKSESFPLTIVDCLFAGKPYIASDVGDIRNMLTIEGKVAGSVIGLNNWEVPIEQAAQVIAAFASDPHKYSNASTLVEALASRYRIDVVASQYVDLFEAGRNNARLGEREICE